MKLLSAWNKLSLVKRIIIGLIAGVILGLTAVVGSFLFPISIALGKGAAGGVTPPGGIVECPGR